MCFVCLVLRSLPSSSSPFVAEWVRNKGHFWKSQFTAAKGAFQLLQIQDDIRRQSNAAESDVESHLRLNKDTLMNSLWKLNVVDIEITLVHVCQMVLQESNVRKEELKMRAMALKILGKAFQSPKYIQNGGTSKKKTGSADEDDSKDICEWSYRDFHLRFCRGIAKSFYWNSKQSCGRNSNEYGQ